MGIGQGIGLVVFVVCLYISWQIRQVLLLIFIVPGEKYFIEQLAERHSNCVVVRDVFPYSVVNQDLGSQELLAPLWQASKESDGLLRNVLVQVRNLWRFAISADTRYGPIYNLSIAQTIVERMNAAHPIARSDRPINLILISTSGGT